MRAGPWFQEAFGHPILWDLTVLVEERFCDVVVLSYSSNNTELDFVVPVRVGSTVSVCFSVLDVWYSLWLSFRTHS